MRQLLASDADAPAAARALLSEFEEVMGWRAGDAALVVSELVTNSVLHGGDDAERLIELVVEFSDPVLRVEVCDQGGAQAAGSVQVVESATGSTGFGLTIVELLADAWGVESNGQTCVWARFERPL
jgi:anti-sigma regulatory factor (Ser/Thr protein kinase)